jgi:hypothetical protein
MAVYVIFNYSKHLRLMVNSNTELLLVTCHYGTVTKIIFSLPDISSPPEEIRDKHIYDMTYLKIIVLRLHIVYKIRNLN